MSQENVEIAKRLADAFAAGGVEAVVPLFAPDAVVYAFPEWPDDSEYHGHDGVRALVRAWTDNFEEFEFLNEEFREVGETVVIFGATAGRIKGSGVPVRQPIGSVYSDFREGKVGEMRNFLTWEEAIEAAEALE